MANAVWHLSCFFARDPLVKWMLLLALVGGWCCADVEVRSYRVSRGALERLVIHSQWNDEITDPFAEDDDFEMPPDRSWPMVKEPGFPSRFLNGDGKLLDTSRAVETILGQPEVGKVVYDVRGEQLVIQADSGIHDELEGILRAELVTGVRITVSIYELRPTEENSGLWISQAFPDGGRLRGRLSLVGVFGQSSVVKSSDGKMELAFECQQDSHFELFENRFTLTSRLEGARFTVMTSLFVPPGVQWIHEMGTTEEGKRVALVIRQDAMTNFGIPLDECFLKEEGGPFLDRERLSYLRERSNPQPGRFDLSKPYQVFRVPTVIPGDLPDGSSLKTHPAIGGGKKRLQDLRDLLGKNGITFRAGDFAFLEPSSSHPESRLYARLSKENLLQLDEIVRASQGEFPEMLQVRVSERDGKGKVLRQLAVPCARGQVAFLSWGRDLTLEVEGQVEDKTGLVELRVTLSRGRKAKKEAIVATGLITEQGREVLMLSSGQGDDERRWVVEANAIEIPPMACEDTDRKGKNQ